MGNCATNSKKNLSEQQQQQIHKQTYQSTTAHHSEEINCQKNIQQQQIQQEEQNEQVSPANEFNLQLIKKNSNNYNNNNQFVSANKINTPGKLPIQFPQSKIKSQNTQQEQFSFDISEVQQNMLDSQKIDKERRISSLIQQKCCNNNNNCQKPGSNSRLDNQHHSTEEGPHYDSQVDMKYDCNEFDEDDIEDSQMVNQKIENYQNSLKNNGDLVQIFLTYQHRNIKLEKCFENTTFQTIIWKCAPYLGYTKSNFLEDFTENSKFLLQLKGTNIDLKENMHSTLKDMGVKKMVAIEIIKQN